MRPLPPPPQPKLTPEQEFHNDVQEWHKLADWLKLAKQRETYLRAKIAHTAFAAVRTPDGAYPEGTNKVTVTSFDKTYLFEMNSKTVREIDEALLMVTLQEANLPAEVVHDLVKAKPELGIRAYRKLPPDKQSIVDKMLTIRQGSITLELSVIE